MYEDIIDLPRHVSEKRPRMSMDARAAQFGAFDPLTGYDEAIHETARLTDMRSEADEYAKSEINRRLIILSQSLSLSPEVSVTYFVPDSKKDGGKYVTYKGIIKKIDLDRRLLVSKDLSIPIDDICSVSGDIFPEAPDEYLVSR